MFFFCQGCVYIFGGWNNEQQFNDLFMLDIENKAGLVLGSHGVCGLADAPNCKPCSVLLWLNP